MMVGQYCNATIVIRGLCYTCVLAVSGNILTVHVVCVKD